LHRWVCPYRQSERSAGSVGPLVLRFAGYLDLAVQSDVRQSHDQLVQLLDESAVFYEFLIGYDCLE